MNWWRVSLSLFVWSVALSGLAQPVPRDTSYTVASAYAKLKKEYPNIQPLHFSGDSRVTLRKNLIYHQEGNRPLLADVFSLSAPVPNALPAVILVHGGGWRTGDKSLLWPMAERLAIAGYVAITVEYRLSLEAPFPAAVHDLKAAILWVKANAANLRIDTARIAMLGCSAGGQLAALVGTTARHPVLDSAPHHAHASTVQAVVDVDGVLAFHHPDSQEGTMAAQWLGGSYEELPENWQLASALTHVGPHTPPTLFLGSKYPRFLAGRAGYEAVLKQHGTLTRTHVFADAPHSFWLFHPWFEPTMSHIIEFLNQCFIH